MKRIKYLLFLTVITACCGNVICQNLNKERDLIQFSGIVVTSDSLTAVPFTHILVQNTHKGTISDYFGYFSFVAKEKDTIIFSAVGYRRVRFIIPDTLNTHKYSLIQVLATDTIYLSETVIHPWSNYKQFEEAFFKLNIPDDDVERAKKNLARAALKERMEKMPMSSSGNYKSFMNQQIYDLSYKGQYRPSLYSAVNNPLLNPFAWAEFIKAWKEGKFRRQDNQDDN